MAIIFLPLLALPRKATRVDGAALGARDAVGPESLSPASACAIEGARRKAACWWPPSI